MPILINSAKYTDAFGVTTNFYIGNAGDRFTLTLNVSSLVRMSSMGNPLTLDPSLNQVLSAGVSWLTEGFRVGMPVTVNIHNSGGGIDYTFSSMITYVDDLMCDFVDMPNWIDITAGQFVTIIGKRPDAPSNVFAREDLEVLFNHSKNSTPGSEFSLIDGEVTKYSLTGLLVAVGATVDGVSTGNQSGQFVESVKITRRAQGSDGWFNHDIIIVFSNSGMYNPDWFFSSDALKNFIKLKWGSFTGETFKRTEAIYKLDGNTGWFNEPHNSSLSNSVLVQGANDIDYSVPSTHVLIVDGPLTYLGIGSAYRSINDNYYKNNLLPQQRLTMAIPTKAVTVGTYSSFLNPSGAGYDLTINSITTVGTVHTINITITPNALFSAFMDSVEEGDRLFYLWVKCGNINWLAYDQQLVKAPPIGGILPMVQDYGYLDHSKNVTTIAGDRTGFVADTEDDIAYLGRFLLDKSVVYGGLSVKIEAFNSVTNEDFTLKQLNFDFTAVQISSDGRYLLNENQTINAELPTTSLKRDAILVLEPTLDTLTQYGVKIYVPWVLNWRTWLPLAGASVDFYPTQNQNWEQYDDTADWVIRTELQLIKDGLAYVHTNDVTIMPYNAEDDILSKIELFDDATGNLVDVVPVGSFMRLKSTHKKLTGNFDPLLVWGQLTVEKTNQSPRFISSSVIAYDNNTSNPLLPLSGAMINIQYPSPDTAVLECYFDSTLIDVSNGVDFTAKIKEREIDVNGFLITDVKQAERAYSVMKVASDNVYSGPLFRVRNNFSGVEADIFPIFNGTHWVADEAAMTSLSGFFGNLTLTMWYDQSGNGQHLYQDEISAQPLIVSGGAIIRDPNNGRPAIQFNGTNEYFKSPALALDNQMLQAFQFTRDSTSIHSVAFAKEGNRYPYPFDWRASINILNTNVGDGFPRSHSTNLLMTGSFLSLAYRKLDDYTFVRLNGVQYNTISSPIKFGAFSMDRVGRSESRFHNGLMQELIYYTVNAYDEAFIEGNINARYNTF